MVTAGVFRFFQLCCRVLGNTGHFEEFGTENFRLLGSWAVLRARSLDPSLRSG